MNYEHWHLSVKSIVNGITRHKSYHITTSLNIYDPLSQLKVFKPIQNMWCLTARFIDPNSGVNCLKCFPLLILLNRFVFNAVIILLIRFTDSIDCCSNRHMRRLRPRLFILQNHETRHKLSLVIYLTILNLTLSWRLKASSGSSRKFALNLLKLTVNCTVSTSMWLHQHQIDIF